MVDDSRHVEVCILVRKLNSGVTNVTSFRVVVVSTTGEHTCSTVHRKHVEDEGRSLYNRRLHRDDRDIAEPSVIEGVDKGEGSKEAEPHSHSKETFVVGRGDCKKTHKGSEVSVGSNSVEADLVKFRDVSSLEEVVVDS